MTTIQGSLYWVRAEMTYILRTCCRMPNRNNAVYLFRVQILHDLEADCRSTSQPSSMRRMQRGMSACLRTSVSQQPALQSNSGDSVW